MYGSTILSKMTLKKKRFTANKDKLENTSTSWNLWKMSSHQGEINLIFKIIFLKKAVGFNCIVVSAV